MEFHGTANVVLRLFEKFHGTLEYVWYFARWLIKQKIYMASHKYWNWNTSMRNKQTNIRVYGSYHKFNLPRKKWIYLSSQLRYFDTGWHVPWNSMEQHISGGHWCSVEFHKTARIIEIGRLKLPRNSLEFHRTIDVTEMGNWNWNRIHWNSMELSVSGYRRHQ